MGDVFKEYSEKNHAEQPALTIMQGEGTIKREDSERNLLYNKSNLSSYKMVYKDDFIVHLRSFEGGLEKASCNGIVSPAYHIFHGEKADSRFYYSYFRSYEFIKRKLVPHIYGIRDGRSIDIAGMKTIDIPYPSFEEQQRIGDYLDSVNNLITFHQCKLNILNKIYRYAWEQRKLGDITVKIGSGKTPSGGKNAYVETGIPLIRSQNVNGDKVNFADIVYIDEATDESMANSRVYTNDVLLNITGASIGRSAVYKGLESANVNQHVCIIRSIEGHQPDFIQLNLSSDNGQKQIDESQAGGGREGLNFQEIGKMQFFFPSLNEQKCIGRYFNSLDHLITLHQQKCKQLQIIRKFMLKNMFL